MMNINEAEWNFHFGKNHNGEPYYSDNKNMMYGRDTGHFGSGTYFSTYKMYPHELRNGEEKINKWERKSQDPHFIQIEDGVYRVDFDLYKNLYRVRSTHHGDVLYSLLKNLNGFYNRISSYGGFKQSEANYNNALLYQQIQRNANALNLKCPSYYDLIRMAQNHTGIQSFSTVFMEYNGYNGVNVSGIPYYDNTTHGSVIYDLSKINTEMKQVEPKSLYTTDRNGGHSSITVFDGDDYEMAAGSGQDAWKWADKLEEMPLNKAIRILRNHIESGEVLDTCYLRPLNDTLQSRYLRLLYKRYASGYSDRWGTDAGSKMFYRDYRDKNIYVGIIIKNNAFYWVNYKPREYNKYETGFTFIANRLFEDIPYESDKVQARIEIMNKLKSYLTRDLTKYEKEFIEYESQPSEFDESRKRKKVLDERLTHTIDEIINEIENRKMQP